MPDPALQVDDPLPTKTDDLLGEILRNLTKYEEAVRARHHDGSALALVPDGGMATAVTDSADRVLSADATYWEQPFGPTSSGGARPVPYATLVTLPSSLRKLRAAARRGQPLSDHETLELVGLEEGERLLNALDRLELAGDLAARDEVLLRGLRVKPVLGPYAAMNRLISWGRYRDAVLLHFDFERLTSIFTLPNRRPNPFKAVGTQGTPGQIVEVLDLLHDRDRTQDTHAVVISIARKRHQHFPYFWAAPLGLLALPVAIALNRALPFWSNSLLNGLRAGVLSMLAIVFYTAVGLLLHRLNAGRKRDMVDVCLALRDNCHQHAAEAILVAARDEKYLIYRRWMAAHRLRNVGLPDAAEFVIRHRAQLDLTCSRNE
jgi:hypothetical protein